MNHQGAKYTFPEMAVNLATLGIELTESTERDVWWLKRGEFFAAFWPLNERLRIRYHETERILSVKLPRLFRVIRRIVELLRTGDPSLSIIYHRALEASRLQEEDDDEYEEEVEQTATSEVTEKVNTDIGNEVDFDRRPSIQEGAMNEWEYYRRELKAASILIAKAFNSRTKTEMSMNIERAYEKLGRITISGRGDEGDKGNDGITRAG